MDWFLRDNGLRRERVNVVLKTFKRKLLVHRFDGFFCFLN